VGGVLLIDHGAGMTAHSGRLRAEETRRLPEAAAQLLADSSDELTVRRTAARAGVSVPTR